MTKIDIFSGFLGAGKTTLIKKLIKEAFAGQRLVLIENEFGEIGIDGGFMKEAGIQVNEMNSGCICCSLVGDFGKALRQVLDTYHPDRILVEPSGVGKLSDVIRAVQGLQMPDVELNSFTTVVDATKCRMYMKNFGEFFNNQVTFANSLVLSRTAGMPQDKLDACIALLRQHNANATVITAPWDALDGAQILAAMEHRNTLDAELALLAQQAAAEEAAHEHEHHHHHDDEGEEHEHHHHHDDEDEEHEHHHHHDDEDEEHEHHHHHHEDEDEAHEHHHHHHADEVFDSWGVETARRYTREELEGMLRALDDEARFGSVLRAKGIVEGTDGVWLHFDHVPGEQEVRTGAAIVTGRLCVIGAKLQQDALRALFGV